MLAGSCACGEIAFESSESFILTLCHCSTCQKTHGGPFAPLMHSPAQGFKWVRGEDRLSHFDSSPHLTRAFCRTCGSPMPIVNRAVDHVAVPASALDNRVDQPPAAHFFVRSKATWFEIGDAAEQFDTVPAGGVSSFLAKIIQSH